VSRNFKVIHGEVGFDVWENDRPYKVGFLTRAAAAQAIKEIHNRELMQFFVTETITNLRATLREDYNMTEEEIIAVIREQLP
jgi:hypothetical protein